MIFVNAYSVTRHYGGPEEGGWWFNEGEPLASVPVVEESSEEDDITDRVNLEIERLERLFAPLNVGNISSVRGGVKIEVREEGHFAVAYPEGPVHYE
jgi:hypothetical protein